MINYFSLRPIKKFGRTFNIIIGGRGTGKTFNSINEDIDDGVGFIYMRRTQDEVNLISSGDDNVDLSPFAKITRVSNSGRYKELIPKTLSISKINKHINSINLGADEKKNVGIMLALSTVAKIRGFDADIYDDFIYDEFIPEKHVHKIGKGTAEADAILNAYETINRNREFEGKKPIRMFLLSNANDIAHPFLEETGLTSVLEKMRRKGKSFVDMPERDCTVTYFEDKEFKEQKSKTALYRFTRGTNFYKMAISNEFSYDDFSLIKSMPLIEYKPYCTIDGISIYRHKSNGKFYASAHYSGGEVFSNSENDVALFYMKYGRQLYGEFVTGDLLFENYAIKKKLLDYIS